MADYEERYLGQLEKAVDRIERGQEAMRQELHVMADRVDNRLGAMDGRLDAMQGRLDTVQGQLRSNFWASVALVVTLAIALIGGFFAATQVILGILHATRP